MGRPDACGRTAREARQAHVDLVHWHALRHVTRHVVAAAHVGPG